MDSIEPRDESLSNLLKHNIQHRSKLRSHFKVFTHQSNNLEIYKCKNCDFETNLKVSLTLHVNQSHKNLENQNKFRNVLRQCGYCDFQTYSMLFLLNHSSKCDKRGNLETDEIHKEIINWLECGQCSYKTKNNNNLKGHIMRMHSTNFTLIHCEKCLFKTKNKSYFQQHLKQHHTNSTNIVTHSDNIVDNLINLKRFAYYSDEEKIDLKSKGRPLPDIIIEKSGSSRGKSYKRHFNKEIYARNDWICGCNKKNALFCFPCLLFGGDKAWTERGVTDLIHLSEKIKKHENSKSHLYNSMELALIGTINIQSQLNPAYWTNIQQHNDNVTKNRYVLSKIINCIKFCGAFELALRGHDESETQNSGIFPGLINFSAELDAALDEHLKNSSPFKDTSEDIQNDLLDCILEVAHEEIIHEINEASCLSVIADETTDVTTTHLVVILRYTRDGEPIERFWTYLNPSEYDAETLTTNILSVVDSLIGNCPNKLISQSYDGAAVMSDQHEGVQAKIKKKYPSSHFLYCYAHQLNLIMSKAASSNSQVRVFFGNLKDVPAFFDNSPQRLEVLNKIVRRKSPEGATTGWNFNIRTINVVFENRESLIECMEEIEETFKNASVCSAASAIRRMLEDSIFVFWLTFFRHVMPHVDILCHQVQNRRTDPSDVKTAIDNFEKNIVQIRNTIDVIVDEASNVCTKPQQKNRLAAIEVCDSITNSVKDRFVFKDHLKAASLFFSDCFRSYCAKFPDDSLTATCLAYPTLKKERLRTELSIIYSRSDCRGLNGTLPLLKFIIQNNLKETLKETKKLLEIIATTPMSTDEVERCFSTLKRIKTFLCNTMSEDRLIALSMLSIEKKFISEIKNFNEKVIDKFANKKSHRIELIYKK